MQAIFGAIFCRTQICDENLKCKLEAISMRFVTVISQGFQMCSKLHATWWQFWGKTEVNMANKQGPNRTGIATSLNLQQKLHLKVQ